METDISMNLECMWSNNMEVYYIKVMYYLKKEHG